MNIKYLDLKQEIGYIKGFCSSYFLYKEINYVMIYFMSSEVNYDFV